MLDFGIRTYKFGDISFVLSGLKHYQKEGIPLSIDVERDKDIIDLLLCDPPTFISLDL